MTDDGKKPFKDQSFWYWNSFSTYVTCLAAFASTLAVLTFMLKENKMYGELLGTMSAGVEALLPVPQLLLI